MKKLFTLLALAVCLQANAQDLLMLEDGKVYPVAITDFKESHFFFQNLDDSTRKNRKVLYSIVSKYHTKNRSLINKVEAHDRNAYDKLMNANEAEDHWYKIDKSTLVNAIIRDTSKVKLVHMQPLAEVAKPIVVPSQLTASYHLERAGNNAIGGAIFVGLAVMIPNVVINSVNQDSISIKKVINQMKAGRWAGIISGVAGLGLFATSGYHLIQAGKRLQADKQLTFKLGIGYGSICYRF